MKKIGLKIVLLAFALLIPVTAAGCGKKEETKSGANVKQLLPYKLDEKQIRKFIKLTTMP